MMNTAQASLPATLTIVVLARENTSYAFRRMLDSLKAQSVSGLQIWVLDCNIPGDPYSLSLQEDVGGMQDVLFLPVPARRSIPEACNELLERVETPYVGFVNSCDIWYSYKAERQLQEMEANPAIRACLCNGYRRMSRTDYVDSSLIFAQAETEVARWLTSDQVLLSSQVIYRTEALRAIGGFDARLKTRMDQDVILRMCDQRSLRIIAEPLFDNAVAYAPDCYDDYQSMRYLMRKHYDILLRNRKQFYFVNMKLMRMASRCTLWLQAAVHFFVAVWKAPFYALGRAVMLGARKAADGVLRLWRGAGISRMTAKIRHSVRQLKDRQKPAVPLTPEPEAAAVEPYVLDPIRDNHPMAFSGNRKLRQVVIPAHMTLIPYGMFAGCSNLERVVIPATVSHIDACAFLNCGKLRQVEIAADSQLTYLGDYAFAGCERLDSLTLPCNINHMGAYAFACCTRLMDIRFVYQEQGEQVLRHLYPAVLDCIATALFAGCSSLRQVEFAEGSMLRSVGASAFLGCADLFHVYLNGKITSIGESAFAWCTALEGFVFPQIDGVDSLGKRAFYHCESLTHFRLPYALKTICRQSFEGCLSLKYVKVPKLVLYIEQRAFQGCRDLESVILISNNTKYAPNAFEAHTRIERS